jgi:alpha/beta hydrolase fold
LTTKFAREVHTVTQLVFVHGIGGARRPTVELENWTVALAKGARRAGHSGLAAVLEDGGIDIAFAYYGDLFDKGQAQGVGVAELDEQSAAILDALLAEVIDAQCAETEDAQTRRTLENAKAQLRPPDTAQAQGPGDLARRAVNAATTVLSLPPLRRAGQWASGRLLVGDLAQVARYLARHEPDESGRTLDEQIRGRVSEALGPGPVVVVAHSLGTVVCLEALQDYQGDVPLLVTLGSPIAMRTVVWPRLVPHPPRTPPQVRRWLNFWDRDDIICARSRIEDSVAPNSDQVRPKSDRVDSDGLWVHTATKYLAQPAVAGPIAEALQQANPMAVGERR